MDTFERNLRDALVEPAPSKDLADKVLARIARQSRKRYTWPIAVAAVFVIALLSFAVLRTTAVDARTMRTDDAGATFGLSDGSQVEMRPKSELALERAADGERINLKTGAIIVNAAPQRKGHLYVQTKDITVAVVGTVFLVNVEEAGSRVSVIQGEVRVQQGSASKALSPGEQVTTNPLMESHPVREEIAWSRNAPAHLALLAQAPAPLKFEVVSLKPIPPNLPQQGSAERLFRCKAIDGVVHATTGDILNLSVLTSGLAALPPQAAVPLGRCIGPVHPRQLVAQGFKVQPRYITYNNEWPAIYQIEAKAENPATVTTDQIREMVQSLLADRYAFKMHREIREGPGCVLRVGKRGPKFSETPGEEEFLPAAVAPAADSIAFKARVRLKTLADSLAMLAAGPVIDQTGLSGIYDLAFTVKLGGGGDGGGGATRGGGGPGSRTVCNPALRDALADQLGLDLEPAKVPVEYIVVDHIEKPTEN